MSLNIQAIINQSYTGIQTFQGLWGIVEKPNVHLSFWGRRYITAPGYEGDCDLHDLNEQIVYISNHYFDLSEKERELGKNIAGRLDDLYETSDEQLEKSFIAFIFSYFREIYLYGKWEGAEANRERAIFTYYTAQKYLEVFGESPDIKDEFIQHTCCKRNEKQKNGCACPSIYLGPYDSKGY
jgi:hypothetical protein